MSDTETKTETKKDATAAKPQDAAPEVAKPHKKSNYVTLAPGQSENQDLHAGYTGSSALVAIRPRFGMVYKLVDDDTTDPMTISKQLGTDLVNKGLFVYTDAPDKDAAPFEPVYDPASPQANMIANGVLTGETATMVSVSVNGGKEQVFVPAPYVTTPDGGTIPVAPQPGFTASEAPLSDAG